MEVIMNKILTFIVTLFFIFPVIGFSENNTTINERKLAPFNTVPLPNDTQLSPSIREALKQNPPINVFRMLANVPQSFAPFMALAKSLLVQGKFNPRVREIATMRVAYLTHSKYEWHQHAFLAKANGVTEKELTIIRSENPVHNLDEEGNFVCQVTDELTRKSELTDKTFKQVYGRYGVEKGSELVLVISYFNMLARFLNGTRVQIEATNPLEGHASPVN
jgi:4-carboxymuconolactone decarboxylase